MELPKKDQSRLKKRPNKIMSQISCIDLFCGAGGLTHGLERGGVQVKAGVDIDPNCRFPYEANNNAIFIEKDLRKLQVEDIFPFLNRSDLTLLAGCAPCQPFSKYNRMKQKHSQHEWDLLLDFIRIMEELKPDLLTMENVPQLLQHTVFQYFLKSLAGYYVWYDIINCVIYGVPQTRKRLVLLASKLGPIQLIPRTHSDNQVCTVSDVISGLPKLSAGESHSTDPLHRASALSTLNLRRISASKPGGTWRDWPDDLLTTCHKKITGKFYSSVYGRMEWESPAPTITTQCFGFGNGRFGHPEQNRAISLREAALIQTFPDDYQFVPADAEVKFSVLGRLIGNAVPVRIGEVIAKSFMLHVKQNRKLTHK
jgi:DNA (cytosine-5)-methyltransferase 1